MTVPSVRACASAVNSDHPLLHFHSSSAAHASGERAENIKYAAGTSIDEAASVKCEDDPFTSSALAGVRQLRVRLAADDHEALAELQRCGFRTGVCEMVKELGPPAA